MQASPSRLPEPYCIGNDGSPYVLSSMRSTASLADDAPEGSDYGASHEALGERAATDATDLTSATAAIYERLLRAPWLGFYGVETEEVEAIWSLSHSSGAQYCSGIVHGRVSHSFMTETDIPPYFPDDSEIVSQGTRSTSTVANGPQERNEEQGDVTPWFFTPALKHVNANENPAMNKPKPTKRRKSNKGAHVYQDIDTLEYMDDFGRRVDRQGRLLVDRQGRLLDEDGNVIQDN
ncbi:hypothetical protein CPC08DRAFT_762957 [Agrocybe pediades]|nr:hypothetical protein CPC08DRAFT_762957 [Agrocybe pediades]